MVLPVLRETFQRNYVHRHEICMEHVSVLRASGGGAKARNLVVVYAICCLSHCKFKLHTHARARTRKFSETFFTAATTTPPHNHHQHHTRKKNSIHRAKSRSSAVTSMHTRWSCRAHFYYRLSSCAAAGFGWFESMILRISRHTESAYRFRCACVFAGSSAGNENVA